MNGTTKLIGLLGWPLDYSLSPHMQNSAFAALKLNYAYVALRVNPHNSHNLKDAVAGIKALGFRGVNVTIPYKQQIISYVNKLSPESLQAKSVNIVWIDSDGLLHGHTTDGAGFLLDLENHGVSNLKNKKIAILGAGGCAHAIALSVLQAGCTDLRVHNRSKHNAEILASEANNLFQNTTSAHNFDDVDRANLVINCTPPGVINNLVFKSDQVIYDTNYMHDALNIKASADLAKARFISGIGMLLYTGALSFELFTGMKAPIDVMRKAL